MQLFLIRGLVAVAFAAVSDSLSNELVVALRRRAQLGTQWPMLLAGVGSVGFGVAFITAAAGADPMLDMLALYAAGGGIDFVVQAWQLARRRRLAAVPA